MENLTHTLLGAALSKAGLERASALATPALLVAVNLPDIDVFGSLFGQQPLDFHRGITHSLVGICGLALLLATAFRAFTHFQTRDPTRQVRFLPMLGICFIGTLSNPLLDLLNDYGLRPWLPFSDRKYYGDLVSIADPWIWIFLTVAAYELLRSSPRRRLWMTFVAIPVVAVFLVGSLGLWLLWLLALSGCAWVGQRLVSRGANLARVMLLACLAYLGMSWLAREYVFSTARDAAPTLINEPIEQIDVLPGRPGSWLQWTVIIQNSHRYWIADTGLHDWRRKPPGFETYEKNLDHPAYRESLGQESMAAMSRFARFPSVSVEDIREGRAVFLNDLRYARRSRAGWGTMRAAVPRPTSP